MPEIDLPANDHDQVPTTRQFATNMFLEMIQKVQQNDHFIVEALQRSNTLTSDQVRDYLNEKIENFYFGKMPVWWTVCLLRNNKLQLNLRSSYIKFVMYLKKSIYT